MAELANIARMTTATTGAGTITLGAAVSGFLTFAQAGITDGQTVSYAIEDGSSREVGRGVYSSAGPTLTRVVLNSTNSNAAINLSGAAEVFITALKEDLTDASRFTSGTLPDARLSAAAKAYGPQQIPLPAGGARPRTTNGSTPYLLELATNDIMLAGQEFSASVEQACQWSFVVPKQLDESATLAGALHWTTAAGTSGNCVWGVRMRAAGNDDAMDGSWGTAVEVTDGFLAQNDDHIIAFSGLTVGNTLAEGDKLFIEVYRKAADAADTLNGTAILTDLMLTVTTNAGNDA